MNIFAWNILHGGGAVRIPEIILAILDQRADVVVLSEFRAVRGGQLRAVLADHGLSYQVVSHKTGRANGVFVASRLPMQIQPARERAPEGAELAPDLAGRQVDVWLPDAATHLTAVHIADDSHPTLKATQWADLMVLAKARKGDRHLIIGDFNTARYGVDCITPLRCRQRLGGLATMGFVDLCTPRDAAGRARSDPTWVAPWGEGRRIDAAWASAPLAADVREAGYVRDVRERGLSDHAGVMVVCGEATLKPKTLV